MQLTEVKFEDIHKIADLAYKIWNEHYPPIIGQVQVDYMLSRFYDLQSLQDQIKNGQNFYLLTVSGIEIGFAAISLIEGDNWFLNKLYVDTKLQRKKYGELILDFLIDKHKIGGLSLQVNRQNYKAINFYFKYGFKIEKLLDLDIGDGFQMNDFVMKLNLHKDN